MNGPSLTLADPPPWGVCWRSLEDCYHLAQALCGSEIPWTSPPKKGAGPIVEQTVAPIQPSESEVVDWVLASWEACGPEGGRHTRYKSSHQRKCTAQVITAGLGTVTISIVRIGEHRGSRWEGGSIVEDLMLTPR